MCAEIRQLGESDVEALGGFFTTIARDESVKAYFRPHAFDHAMAERICLRQGIERDEYFAAFEADEIVAYGMLRGWDEGYAIPAFGVCVRGDQRGKGLGRAILDFAVMRARAAGAPSVMLKVFEDNVAARTLYERCGFTFNERTPDGSQLVGWLPLEGGTDS